jgi:hypothetical protein
LRIRHIHTTFVDAMYDESEGRDHWPAFYTNSLDMLMIKIRTVYRKLQLPTEFQRFGDHKVEISQDEGVRLQLRGEFFNAFNHVNFDAPNKTVSSIAFGRITGAGAGCAIQLAAKIIW